MYQIKMSDLGWPWPLVLICTYCLIRLHISSKYNDFGFKGYRKVNFLRFFPDALGNKYDLDVNLGSSFEQIL